MKRFLLLWTVALALLLSGCGGRRPSQLEYIGADAAKALALSAAGVTAQQAVFSEARMGAREGLDYYSVTFTAGGQTYQYHIDALTGAVIDHQGPAAGGQTAEAGGQPAEQQAPPGSLVTDADTYGSGEQAPAGSDVSSDGQMLSEEEARAIVLAHAGLTARQATFVKSGLDWDDGVQTYDLEFYSDDGKEYDYEIDPRTGAVLSVDYDAEYYTPPASASITADEAKAMALAQVPGATLEDIWEFEVDYDDGRLEYEGKIYYDHMEYEFEIDGYSGAIRSWEVESIYD